MPISPHGWNARYDGLAGVAPPDKPASILPQVLPLLPRGRALDIACGAGRNAVFLASKGWDTTAVDSSSSGLELARSAAQAAGISVSASDIPGNSFARKESQGKGQLVFIEADLETLPLPAAHFDLVICINYLQRSLFPSIENALRARGALIYETYTRSQLQFSSGPRNPDFLLHAGELRDAFPNLTTLFYRELSAGKGIASLLALKAR
jgi:tellurite methyltransferase